MKFFFPIFIAAVLALGGCNPDPTGLIDFAPLGVPKIDVEKYTLSVTGEVDNELVLTYQDLLALKQVSRSVPLPLLDRPAQPAVWTGVPLAEVLNQAGVKKRADRILFRCAEGFETSFPVKDAYREDMILATGVNGQPLPRRNGYPLRLVAGGKYDYKWAKWLTEIRLIRGDHRGYWEIFDLDNDGDVPLTMTQSNGELNNEKGPNIVDKPDHGH